MEAKSISDIVHKFERLADGFADRNAANTDFYYRRRFLISTAWGKGLKPGDSVLELGCGDGYLAQMFVRYGLIYRGVDVSPNMVAAAERRFRNAGLKGEFIVADLVRMPLSDSFDAVVSFQTFFEYMPDPLTELQRLRRSVRKKVVMDLNPRGGNSLERGLELFQKGGFRNVTWRPFFVPQRQKLPIGLLKTLVACENVPVLRKLLLNWKFLCLLKGEVD
jgi:SAM-dependent methyltransferase